MQNQVVSTQIQHLDAETLLLRFANLEDKLNGIDSRIKPPSPLDEYLTQDEVAKLLKVSKVTVWQWSKPKIGILTPRHIGNKVRYLKSEVIAAVKVIGKEVQE